MRTNLSDAALMASTAWSVLRAQLEMQRIEAMASGDGTTELQQALEYMSLAVALLDHLRAAETPELRVVRFLQREPTPTCTSL